MWYTVNMGKRILWLVIAFVLGFVAAWLHVLAPIHELCHVIASWMSGGTGRLDGWTHAVTAGLHTEFVRYAGFYGEMLVYFMFFGIGMIWKLRVRGVFWFGAAHSTYLISARASKDFESWSDFSTRDWGAVQALGIFYFVFGVFLVLSWILLIGREVWYWENREEVETNRRPVKSLEDIRRRWG